MISFSSFVILLFVSRFVFLFDPFVAAMLQLEGELFAAALHNLAVEKHMHEVGHDVPKTPQFSSVQSLSRV